MAAHAAGYKSGPQRPHTGKKPPRPSLRARTWKTLYADPKTKTEWEADVKAKLPVYVKQAMGGAYFDGFAPTKTGTWTIPAGPK